MIFRPLYDWKKSNLTLNCLIFQIIQQKQLSDKEIIILQRCFFSTVFLLRVFTGRTVNIVSSLAVEQISHY